MLENNFKLHPNEKVLLVIRKHIIFLVWDIVSVAFLFLIPSILIWVAQYLNFIPDFKIFGVSFYSLTDVMIYMWAIICWLQLADRFTDYALDVWILTDKRLVESELVKLFDRKISTLELQDIEDITVHTFGLLGNYFSFGRLDVQTAGTVTEFFAEKIANPEYVQNQIFDAKLKDEHERKDIEKTEIEQISHRVYGEEEKSKLAPEADSHIPHDQKVTVEQKIPPTSLEEGDSTGFDWAHVSEKQEEDIRDLQAQLEVVENKYKTGVKEALRTE